MSEIPQCVQCGGTEYVLESGFYFCAECHIQSQDIQEQVFEEYYGGQRATRQSVATPRSKDDRKDDTKGAELTSFEVLNLILKGLVQELILLGADPELKRVVLQLWANFLIKNQIAFISTQVEVKPRLGVAFKISDAELLYGAKKETASLCKQPVYRKRKHKSSTGSSSDTSSGLTARSRKIRLTLKKKALAKAEYESASEHHTPTPSLARSSPSELSSKKSYKLRFTKHAEEKLTELLSGAEKAKCAEERMLLQERLLVRERTSARHPGVFELLTIIRLGLLIIKSPIHLSDIFRWSREGYLSVRQCEKLLPRGTRVGRDMIALFIKSVGSWERLQRSTSKMADLLGCSYLRVDLLAVCRKFVEELALPGEIMDVIGKMMYVKWSNPKLTQRTNYEGRAVAYIIVALKLLFSLDDSTEYNLSRFARKINKCREKTVVFNWEEWQQWTERRLAVMALYSQGIRDRHYADSRVGGPGAFLSQWDYSPPSQLLPRKEAVEKGLADSIRGVLGDLSRDATEPIPPSLTPMSDTTQILRERSEFPHSPDFTLTSLRPFISAPELEEAVREVGGIRIMEGTGVTIKEVERGAGMKERRRREGKRGEPVEVRTRSRREVVKRSGSSSDGRSSSSSSRSSSSGRSGEEEEEEEVVRVKRVDLTRASLEPREDRSVCVPHTEYWLYHGVFTTMSLYDFQRLSREVFPSSFLWLLSLCSKAVDQSPRDVYTQVALIEKIYLHYLSPRYTGRTLPDSFLDKW